MAEWEDKAAAFLRPWKGLKIAAAVSGGPDSMAMLDFLRREGLDLAVCHVNYQKRDTAGRDEEIVKKYCMRHQIPFRVLKPQNAKGNFQGWARQVRYDFFLESARELGCSAVALAHQQDDVLETWLMQKEKNILPECYGLKETGHWKDLAVIRPLLAASKQDLQDYCDARQIAYGIDESNLGNHYRRNQLRHSVLDAADPKQKEDLLVQMEDDRRKLEEKRRKAKGFLAEKPAVDLLVQNDAWFLLEAWLSSKTGHHYGRKHMEELVKKLSHDQVIELDGWQIERYKNNLLAVQTEDVMTPVVLKDAHALQSMEDIPFGSSVCRFELKADGRKIESFTVSEEDFPLMIGPWKNTDQIRLSFGTKKVGRALMDRRIPKVIRTRIPVIKNRWDQVIFVPFIGCDVAHFSCKPGAFMVELTAYIR